MDNTEITKKLASVLRELSMLYKHVANTSTSLLAVTHALEEVSPQQFAPVYQKYFLAPDLAAVKAALERHAQTLLDRADSLHS
jgi:hypothetical protein